jgi:hypothetical protein
MKILSTIGWKFSGGGNLKSGGTLEMSMLGAVADA